MRLLLDSVSISRKPIHLLGKALLSCAIEANRYGLSLYKISFEEYHALYKKHQGPNWPETRMDMFDREDAVCIVAYQGNTLVSVITGRPFHLDKDESVGDTLETKTFIHPNPEKRTGLPDEKFEDIPPELYALHGTPWLVGGFWIDPNFRSLEGEGLTSSSRILEIMTRAIFTTLLGTTNASSIVSIMYHRITVGWEKGRSIAQKYGFRYKVSLTWKNFKENSDLKTVICWADSAQIATVLTGTDWIQETKNFLEKTPPPETPTQIHTETQCNTTEDPKLILKHTSEPNTFKIILPDHPTHQ